MALIRPSEGEGDSKKTMGQSVSESEENKRKRRVSHLKKWSQRHESGRISIIREHSVDSLIQDICEELLSQEGNKGEVGVPKAGFVFQSMIKIIVAVYR